MSLIEKYKQYFESWLSISVDEMLNHDGIHISSNAGRHNKPDGSLLYFPLTGFEIEDSLFISCIPEWEDELRILTKNVSVPAAIEELIQFTKGKHTLLFSRHAFWGLNKLNPNTNLEKAVLLGESHIDAYIEFYRKIHPGLCSIIDPNEWIAEGFNELVGSQTTFCIFEDEDIVCATASERLPYEPNELIQIGVTTLESKYRKGYATQACAAFINYHSNNDKLPVWKCDTANTASNMLANKLGFKHLGSELYISSICSM